MTPGELNQHIRHFFDAVGRSEIEIYNEFSLQHEFGIWLRARIGEPQTRIQFERPARFFGVDRKLTKKEIDLACFTPPVVPLAAVEFKFPRAGQVCFRFVFTGDPEEAERSKVLEKLREDLENKRYLLDRVFGERDVRFVVNFRSSTGRVGSLSALLQAKVFLRLSRWLLHELRRSLYCMS